MGTHDGIADATLGEMLARAARENFGVPLRAILTRRETHAPDVAAMLAAPV